MNRTSLAAAMSAALVVCPAPVRAQADAPAPTNQTLLAARPRDAASPTGHGPAIAAMRLAGDAVVHVFVEVDDGRSQFKVERPSSGVVVHESGLVVTLWSLVREIEGSSDKRLVVRGNDAEHTRHTARLVAKDEALGLALLRIDAPPGDLVRARIATDRAAPGTPVLILARPDEESPVAYAGVTTPAVGGTTIDGLPLDKDDILLTDARPDRRSDGAAVLDGDGNLLGILCTQHVLREVREPTLEVLMAPTYAFAIPADRIRATFAAHWGEPLPAPSRGAEQPPTAAAVAAAKAAVVAVFAVDPDAKSGLPAGKTPTAGDDDPHADTRRKGIGSGVIVSRTGLVVTNAHIVAGARAMQIHLLDGRTFRATPVQVDLPGNLALLQLDLPTDTKLPVARCGTDADLMLGETLIAVGNPLGHTPTVTSGVLSARRRGGRLQVDPDIGNSNAGGALIDVTGCVVGIVDGGIIDPIEMAFQIRGDEAKAETNLSTCLGIDAVRKHLGGHLAKAQPGESILAPVASTAAEHQVRTTPVTAVVERDAAAMLNIYVSWTSAAVDEAQNPFASAQQATVVGKSLGSGVIIDSSGLALTNWHVVDDATEPDGSMRKDHVVKVRVFDGRELDAKVLSISREDDLALLQLVLPEGVRVHAVQLGSAAALRLGETVLAIGNPHGFANTITAGIVTAKDQRINVKGRWAKLEHLIETDAAINGGNSGGALIDLDGRLVGINSAGSGGVSSRGYAINVDHVRQQVLRLLMSPEKLRSPDLGLRVADVDGRVVVDEVIEAGPAERAGVQVGDFVRTIDGADPAWSPGFAMRLLAVGDGELRPVALGLRRDGEDLDVAVMPLSAAVWAVRRQTGLEVEAVPFRAEPETLRAASIALHRRFTNNPNAEPHTIQTAAIRVTRRHGVDAETDVQPGDLLLAAEFLQATAAGDAYELVRFERPEDVQRCFNDVRRGSYEGASFRCWLFRDGKIRVVDLIARRLLP